MDPEGDRQLRPLPGQSAMAAVLLIHVGALPWGIEELFGAVRQAPRYGAEGNGVVEPLADLCRKFELWIGILRSLEGIEHFVGDLRWALHSLSGWGWCCRRPRQGAGGRRATGGHRRVRRGVRLLQRLLGWWLLLRGAPARRGGGCR